VYAAAAAAGATIPPADVAIDGSYSLGAIVPHSSIGAGSASTRDLGGEGSISVSEAVQRAVATVQASMQQQLLETERVKTKLEEAARAGKVSEAEVHRLRDSNGRLYAALEDADGGLARLQQASTEAEKLAEQRRVEGDELRNRVRDLEKRLRAYHRSREELKGKLQVA